MDSLPLANKRLNKLVAGITLDDLPIAPLGTLNPVMMYYLDFPVKRKLDWSTDENGNPKRRNLKDAGSLIAGFVQTRGELAETPCNWCSQGKGVWERCVIGSDVQDGKPMSEACANCRFSRRVGCTFREYLAVENARWWLNVCRD